MTGWKGNEGYGRLVEHEGARVRLAFDPGTIPAADLIARITARHPVRDLFVENPPIEQVIARLYAGTPVRDYALENTGYEG